MVTLTYRIESEEGAQLKLKVEINTREHFTVLGFQDYEFISNSSWCPGGVSIQTYKIAELLGTKMRALYQRRKGRDLYDLHMALTTISNLDVGGILRSFLTYSNFSGQNITKTVFLKYKN